MRDKADRSALQANMSAEDVARKLGRLDLVPDSTNAGKEYLQASLEVDIFPFPFSLLEASDALLLPKGF